MTSWAVQTWVSGPPRAASLVARSAVLTFCAPLGVDCSELRLGEHAPPTHWPLFSTVAKHFRLFATVGSGPPGPPPVLEKHMNEPGPKMLEPEEGPMHASSATATSTTPAVTSVLPKVVAHWTVQRCVVVSQVTPPTPNVLTAPPQSALVAHVWFTGLGQSLLADAPAPWLSTGLSSVTPTRRATPGSTLT